MIRERKARPMHNAGLGVQIASDGSSHFCHPPCRWLVVVVPEDHPSWPLLLLMMMMMMMTPKKKKEKVV